MSEIEDAVKDTIDSAKVSRLNTAVAIMVALTATLMAIGNIKDGNITQAMDRAQAHSVSTWSYFQAKSTKQHIVEGQLDQIKLRLATEPSLSAPAKALLEKTARDYEAEIKRYDTEKAQIQKDAKGYEAEYDRLNFHDDQFDMSEAFFTVAIALFGVTALTQKRWLFGFALVLSVLGALLEAASFLGWNLHPDWLAQLLG